MVWGEDSYIPKVYMNTVFEDADYHACCNVYEAIMMHRTFSIILNGMSLVGEFSVLMEPLMLKLVGDNSKQYSWKI